MYYKWFIQVQGLGSRVSGFRVWALCFGGPGFQGLGFRLGWLLVGLIGLYIV